MLGLLAGLPAWAVRRLFVATGLVLAAVFVAICRIRPSWANVALGLGAALWTAGNALWLGGLPLVRVVPWWAGFSVLTMAGERLELAHMVAGGGWRQRTFLAGVALLLAGLVVTLVCLEAGLRIVGLALLALALWLLRYDAARRTIRQAGLIRSIAACLLPGYLWLGAAGVFWLLWAGLFAGGVYYDAMLHAAFVGFVFSMIFGHAPIILPAVAGVTLP